jgi:O-antigen/teichoic acid export membrane protein
VPDLKALFVRLKARLTSGSFFANVAVLAGGTAFAQGLAVSLAPVLTRLYSPDDFGVMTVYASLLAMATVVASLSYQLAIPLPDDDKTAASVLALALLITLLTSALLLVGVQLWGPQLAALVNAPKLAPYLWMLPLGLVLGGVYQALNYWAVRKKAFTRITRTRVNQSLTGALSQVILGLLQVKPLGLLIGVAAGQSAGSGTLGTLAWQQDQAALRGISWAGIWQMACRYRRFPFMASPAGLLNSAALALPAVFLSAYYGSTAAGHFGLTLRVMGMPLALVGVAVSQVFLAEASRTVQDAPGETYGLLMRTVRRLALMAGGIGFLGVLGPWVFAPLFGGQWREAGVYFLAMTPAACTQFIVSPISTLALVMERQDLQLSGDAIRAALIVAVFMVAHRYGLSALQAITIHSLAMTLTYAGYFLLYRSLARRASAAPAA